MIAKLVTTASIAMNCKICCQNPAKNSVHGVGVMRADMASEQFKVDSGAPRASSGEGKRVDTATGMAECSHRCLMHYAAGVVG